MILINNTLAYEMMILVVGGVYYLKSISQFYQGGRERGGRDDHWAIGGVNLDRRVLEEI